MDQGKQFLTFHDEPVVLIVFYRSSSQFLWHEMTAVIVCFQITSILPLRKVSVFVLLFVKNVHSRDLPEALPNPTKFQIPFIIFSIVIYFITHKPAMRLVRLMERLLFTQL